MLVRLEGYGATLQQAVLAAVLVRLLTVWLTAALGVAGCWRLWRLDRRLAVSGAWTPAGSATEAGPGHFDALGAAYAGELSPGAGAGGGAQGGPHRARLVRGRDWTRGPPAGRRLRAGVVRRRPGRGRLPRGGRRPGAGAGHGRAGGGWHRPGLLAASVAGPPVPERGIRRRPGGQRPAPCRRPRRPGCRPGRDGPHRPPRGPRPGARDLHRQSPLPPLHGLPLSPLEAHRPGHGGLARPPPASHRRERRPATLHHYTFLPDFTPGGLYRYLAPLEQWLERSRWAPYAAHFTAVYQRRQAPVARAPRVMASRLRAPQGALS